MKDNYWIDFEMLKKEKVAPGIIKFEGSFKILSDNEFNSRIKYKIREGIGGLLIGVASIGGGYLTNKYLIPEQNKTTFYNLIYVIGAASATSGSKKTFDYFKHRNDKKPESIEQAIFEIMRNTK